MIRAYTVGLCIYGPETGVTGSTTKIWESLLSEFFFLDSVLPLYMHFLVAQLRVVITKDGNPHR